MGYRASGLSIGAFCTREGVLVASFYYWSRQLGGNRAGAKTAEETLRFVTVLCEVATWGTSPKRSSQNLLNHQKRLREAIDDLRLDESSRAAIMQALRDYNMFSPKELVELEREIVV